MPNSRRRKWRSRRNTDSRSAYGSSKALEERPTLSRRRWFLTIKWVIGGAITLFITLFGVIAGVVSIWGPPWPTGPTVHPTGLDSAKPLTVPFDIVNKSIFFSVHIRFIGCGFLNEFTVNPGTKIIPSLIGFGVDMTIPPDDQIPYGCNVNLNLYQPTPFEMCFLIVYDGLCTSIRST